MTLVFSSEFLEENPLDESLVLEFQYHDNQKDIILVYDYAAEIVSNHFKHLGQQNGDRQKLREFRRIVFSSVTELRVSSEHLEGEKAMAMLTQKLEKPGIVVESTKLVEHGQYSSLYLGLSSGFKVTFCFQMAKVERKLCSAEQTANNEWQYHDVETQRAVDFSHPFE